MSLSSAGRFIRGSMLFGCRVELILDELTLEGALSISTVRRVSLGAAMVSSVDTLSCGGMSCSDDGGDGMSGGYRTLIKSIVKNNAFVDNEQVTRRRARSDIRSCIYRRHTYTDGTSE